jgi:hypothetical protein
MPDEKQGTGALEPRSLPGRRGIGGEAAETKAAQELRTITGILFHRARALEVG